MFAKKATNMLRNQKFTICINIQLLFCESFVFKFNAKNKTKNLLMESYR